MNYANNRLTIGFKPVVDVIPTGVLFGTPAILIGCGTEKQTTNKDLADLVESLEPQHVVFTHEDPMLFHDELWSFIKYYKSDKREEKIWHIITSGIKYNARLLYEVDDVIISINDLPMTPPEFIVWCVEDLFITNKVQFSMTVNCVAEHITFVRDQINKLGTFKKPISVMMGARWDSFDDMKRMFIDTVKYKNIRYYA